MVSLHALFWLCLSAASWPSTAQSLELWVRVRKAPSWSHPSLPHHLLSTMPPTVLPSPKTQPSLTSRQSMKVTQTYRISSGPLSLSLLLCNLGPCLSRRQRAQAAPSSDTRFSANHGLAAPGRIVRAVCCASALSFCVSFIPVFALCYNDQWAGGSPLLVYELWPEDYALCIHFMSRVLGIFTVFSSSFSGWKKSHVEWSFKTWGVFGHVFNSEFCFVNILNCDLL